ncbi:putative polysaccharide biosynthesis protein [Salipaludibacillus daqingensis]|uniref:putative polysaccharide biosynthesis protein n=1 Tax=Salipaludibacillus daqingensis TaxID=3041001 RepID=UPI002476125C|nr:polysaccharide biosynthesis protein [Salipaludibacillus daqingensis]
MKHAQQQQTWMKGALYLSLAAIIVKALSALYKIPYQNITGDTGFYVYQQVYPIYGVIFVLGAYGFPLVIATFVANHDTKTQTDVSSPSLSHRLSFLFLCLLSLHIVAGLAIVLGAEMIAQLMGDPRLTSAIRWMGAPVFLIPFLAMGRGIYQGKGEMIPTAFSQVVEQTFRVTVILGVAFFAMKASDPYMAGTSAGIGALAGSIAGVIVLGTMGWKTRELHPLKLMKWTIPTGWKNDVKTLFITGVLVSVSAMALVIFQLVDSVSVFRLLVLNDTELNAAIAKGVYDRGWPLVQFGAVITTVFSYAAIPHISRAYEAKKMEEVKEEMSRALKMCFVFGGAAATGMVTIMPSLNQMMFTDQSGTFALQLLSSIVFFGAIFMTIAALLHAVGKASLSVIVLGLGIVLKGIFNMIFVPTYGINGAAISSALPFVIMSFLSIFILIRSSLWNIEPFQFWWKWFISLLGMVIFVSLFQAGTTAIVADGRIAMTFISLTAASSGAVIFLWMIYRLRLFTTYEWESIPKIGRWFPYESKELVRKRRNIT